MGGRAEKPSTPWGKAIRTREKGDKLIFGCAGNESRQRSQERGESRWPAWVSLSSSATAERMKTDSVPLQTSRSSAFSASTTTLSPASCARRSVSLPVATPLTALVRAGIRRTRSLGLTARTVPSTSLYVLVPAVLDSPSFPDPELIPDRHQPFVPAPAPNPQFLTLPPELADLTEAIDVYSEWIDACTKANPEDDEDGPVNPAPRKRRAPAARDYDDDDDNADLPDMRIAKKKKEVSVQEDNDSEED